MLSNIHVLIHIIVMYVITLTIRMNAEVLKSRSELPDILSIVSNHLFGQLEGYIITSDQSIASKWQVCD